MGHDHRSKIPCTQCFVATCPACGWTGERYNRVDCTCTDGWAWYCSPASPGPACARLNSEVGDPCPQCGAIIDLEGIRHTSWSTTHMATSQMNGNDDITRAHLTPLMPTIPATAPIPKPTFNPGDPIMAIQPAAPAPDSLFLTGSKSPSFHQMLITLADPGDDKSAILYGPCTCGHLAAWKAGEEVAGVWDRNTAVQVIIQHHLKHLDERHDMRPVMRCNFTYEGTPLRCTLNSHDDSVDHEFRAPGKTG